MSHLPDSFSKVSRLAEVMPVSSVLPRYGGLFEEALEFSCCPEGKTGWLFLPKDPAPPFPNTFSRFLLLKSERAGVTLALWI